MIQPSQTDKLVFDLKIHQIDYSEEKREALRHRISEKYNVPLKNVEVNLVPINTDNDGNVVSLAQDVISSIQDPQFQQQLFAEYIQTKGIKDINMDDIVDIDNHINSFIDFDTYSKYKCYKFKYVKWSNYLSYGKDNYFNFSDLKGLVLLNGQPENQCGKTTFAIDLLRFALFGKAQKSPTLDSVFNAYLPEETEVIVEAGIEIDACDYVIRRTITRPPLNKRKKKYKTKQKVEYFRLINDEYELIENCEGESTAATNNIIKESVGSIDDFNLIISATAYSLGDLLRIGQTDKSKLFSKWLGLLSIEKKEEVAKEIWKTNLQPKLFSTRYNRSALESENNDLKKCVDGTHEQINDTSVQLESSKQKLLDLNQRKAETLKQRKEIREELARIDVTTLNTKLNEYNELLEKKRATMRLLKDEYLKVKTITFNREELSVARKELENLRLEISNLNVKNTEIKTVISGIKSDSQRINTLINGKRCPTCGQEIDIQLQNAHLRENEAKIKQLIEEGINNKKKIDELNICVENTSKQIERLENNQELVRKKNELELKLTAIKSNIDNIKLQIKELLRQKEEIETNKENIQFNNEIDNKVNILNETIKEEEKIKENYIRDIEKYKNEISKYNDSIRQREEIIEKIKEEEKLIRNWALYQEMVGKNGIIKLVLKKALPILNNEISRLLNGLCDFNVEITISDDNKVCMDMIRQGKRLDLGICASGFETVMASIAIRHALASIATLSKPNFTTYDEVLDGVAVSNYENVHELFKRITLSQDFIIHITHNEMISDWHDKIITVTKDTNGISKLTLVK